MRSNQKLHTLLICTIIYLPAVLFMLLAAQQVLAQSASYTTAFAGTWSSPGMSYNDVIVFREDGTFSRGISGSGSLMTGSIQCKGTYSVEQGVLIMRVPGNGDVCNTLETYRFRFISRDQLYLKGVGNSVMDDTFNRTK